MIHGKKLRKLLESRVDELGPEAGHKRFANDIKLSVGAIVEEADGALIESFDDRGVRVKAANTLSPYEYDFKELAYAIGGHEFVERFDPRDRQAGMTLLESSAAIDPTAFLNVSTWSAAVTGLLDAAVLEKFQNAAYIGDQLVTTRPTRLNGEKMIGTGGVSASVGETERKPGQPHDRVTAGERWINTPELRENAKAMEVTQEAVFYDRTGEVLDLAAGVGEILGYEREKEQLRLVGGITNPYSYKGTSYNTFQTATPWINSHVNPASTYADVDDALKLLNRMTDPETGREILIDRANLVLLIDPEKTSLWHFIKNSTEVRETASNTQMLAGAPPNTKNLPEPIFSQIFHNLMDAEGGRTDAQAIGDWYMGNPKKAFAWMEAWPLRTFSFSGTEMAMVDRGLVLTQFANYRGIGAVLEPRYWQQNKES